MDLFKKGTTFKIVTHDLTHHVINELRDLRNEPWITLVTFSIQKEFSGGGDYHCWKAYIVTNKEDTLWGVMAKVNPKWIAYDTEMTIEKGIEWAKEGLDVECYWNK